MTDNGGSMINLYVKRFQTRTLGCKGDTMLACFRVGFAILCGLLLSMPVLAQTPAPESEGGESASWFVISKAGADKLSSLLPLDKSLEDGWRIESVSIEKDRVRLCLDLKADPKDSRRQCGFLYHPAQGFPGSETLSDNASLLLADIPDPAPAWASIRKALNALPAEFWQAAKRETSGPIGSNSSWAQTLWYLLAQDETKLATRVLESIEAQDLHERTRQLFAALVAGQEGRRDDAMQILDKLADSGDASDPHIKLVRGRVAMLTGDIENGAKWISEAQANLPPASPNRCAPAGAIPKLLADRGRREEAVAAWNATLSAFSDCKDILIAFSDQLLDWGMTDLAMQTVEQRLTITPDDTDVLFQKVAVLRRQKKVIEAIDLLRRINEMKPNQEPVISLHSTLASSLQEAEAYRAEMLKRAETNPDDLFAVHAAGVMSYYAGQYDIAKRLMDSLKDRLPHNARVFIYAAMSRYQTNDWEGAKAGLDKLLEIGTKDPDLYYCYAMLYSTRDTTLSRQNLEEYLAVPHHPDAVPAKQQRAWHEWELLGKGIVPPEWMPGAEHVMWDAPANDDKDSNDGLPPQLGLGLTAAISLLLGGLLGLRIGRRSKRS
jgi:tetratricopeptide (TPR) repeat protein